MGMFDEGGKTFKFAQAGDSVTGTIREWREEQQHEFDRLNNRPSDKLATYDDGNPIMQLVLTLSTGLRDDDEDDGTRYVYVSGKRAKTAVRNAVRAAGARVPEEGARFTMTLTGTDPASFNASAKTFTAAYEKPERASQTFGTGQQPVQQPLAAPVSQAAPGGQADQWASTVSDADAEKVKALLAMGVGLTDQQLSAATGVPVGEVAKIRESEVI